MALDAATLKAEILKLIDPDDPALRGLPGRRSTAAQNWADAFDAFASQAEDASEDAFVPGTRRASRLQWKGALPPRQQRGAAAAMGLGPYSFGQRWRSEWGRCWTR